MFESNCRNLVLGRLNFENFYLIFVRWEQFMTHLIINFQFGNLNATTIHCIWNLWTENRIQTQLHKFDTCAFLHRNPCTFSYFILHHIECLHCNCICWMMFKLALSTSVNNVCYAFQRELRRDFIPIHFVLYSVITPPDVDLIFHFWMHLDYVECHS